MAQSLKDSPEQASQSVIDRRRGKRLFLNFTIEITGFDGEGRRFVERTKTEDISESGCRLNTNIPLKCGDLVEIKLVAPRGENLPEECAQQFEVMWVAKEKAGWSIGARKATGKKMWKVSFPPPKSSYDPRPK